MGLSTSPKRGFWLLTPKGIAYAAKKRGPLSQAALDVVAQATDFARSVQGIVLIDGARLAGLLIEHAVGVSHNVVKVPKLDSDYFEE